MRRVSGDSERRKAEVNVKQMKQVKKSQQYLTFFLGEDEYAIGILRVREILEYGTVTRVPNTPGCIRGVVNLRGSVLPIVDLAARFGLPSREPTKQTCIVVVEVELEGRQTTLGVLADAVNQVIDLKDEQINRHPPSAAG